MNKYNVKASKLQDGSYKLKINNVDYYDTDETIALAFKYLQRQLEQKEQALLDIKEYIEEPNRDKYDFSKAKILEIINKALGDKE